MGAIGTLLLKAGISYLETHPAVVESLIAEGVSALIAWVQTLKTPAPAK